MAMTSLVFRWGKSVTNPTAEQMRSALAELATPDSEHPDCWFTDDFGWGISAFESGKVILENAETGEGPWHLLNVERERVLEFWLALQRADIKSVRTAPWQDGYGNKSI
jgi:hypothetical protein